MGGGGGCSSLSHDAGLDYNDLSKITGDKQPIAASKRHVQCKTAQRVMIGHDADTLSVEMSWMYGRIVSVSPSRHHVVSAS